MNANTKKVKELIGAALGLTGEDLKGVTADSVLTDEPLGMELLNVRELIRSVEKAFGIQISSPPGIRATNIMTQKQAI